MLNQLIKNVLRLSGVVLLPGLLITACEQAPVTDIDDQEVPSVTEFLRSMNPVDAPNVKFGGTPTRLVKPSMYIDGHLVTADNMGVYEDMQPDDIESVRLIVKDAARAKYGQDVHRAMEITLKKGWQNNR